MRNDVRYLSYTCKLMAIVTMIGWPHRLQEKHSDFYAHILAGLDSGRITHSGLPDAVISAQTMQEGMCASPRLHRGYTLIIYPILI